MCVLFRFDVENLILCSQDLTDTVANNLNEFENT